MNHQKNYLGRFMNKTEYHEYLGRFIIFHIISRVSSHAFSPDFVEISHDLYRPAICVASQCSPSSDSTSSASASYLPSQKPATYSTQLRLNKVLAR